MNPIQSENLERILDNPLIDDSEEQGLTPIAHYAQEDVNNLIHDLAVPSEERNNLLAMELGTEIAIPSEWISNGAKEEKLHFVASVDGFEDETGYPILKIQCKEFQSATAFFWLMWC